jgi:hypothetical protein
MKISARFKDAIEQGPGAELPDYVWIVYAVCAIGPSACGWAGWIFDAIQRITGAHHPTASGDELLGADYSQRCPSCGGDLFRTEHSVKLDRSPDQTRPGLVPGRHYEVGPIEYEDP